MALLPVHEMQTDRATGMARLARVNPTRIYIRNTPSGFLRLTHQNGRFVNENGEPLDEASIPADVREDIERNPVSVDGLDIPEVTKTCKVCGDTVNSSQIEEHLMAHVKALVEKTADTKPEPSKTANPVASSAANTSAVPKAS